MNYQNIKTELADEVLTIRFNRPAKHNALHPEMMGEIISLLSEAEKNDKIRIILFQGEGKSFCAGADIQWMKDAAALDEKANLKDSEMLSQFFSAIYHSSKVTMAMVHGNIFGGGNGIVAACDLAYGVADCSFSLSEARLGLIAATITPYMLKKIKVASYKELIFSARVFNGKEAEQMGLLNKSFMLNDAMHAYVDKIIDQIKGVGPNALKGSKKLINDLQNPELFNQILESIPKLLAEVRVTTEAKEGFTAFLEKRKPNWNS